jgi:ABC-type Na+ efflux pump permease subunit
MVCVIHCFFAPSLLIFSYSFLSFSLESELVHYLILATAVPISLLALFLGFKNHQTYSSFYIGIIGLILMTLAVILGEGNIGESGERFFTTIGSLIVAFAHFQNHRACKNLECDDCHD